MSSGQKKVVPIQKEPSGAWKPVEKKPVSRAELDLILQKALELAQKAPGKAAMILTEWLKKPRKLDHIRDHGTPAKKKAG
jgi:hypothetical protein